MGIAIEEIYRFVHASALPLNLEKWECRFIDASAKEPKNIMIYHIKIPLKAMMSWHIHAYGS